jgi:iron complex outermembrane receptor protein
LNVVTLQAQDSDSIAFYNFDDEITVTASRIPTSLPLVARSVMVITAKELKQMPVQSVQELLQYIPSVDLQQRGPAGVQADLSIRGSTFEQTLLLINGIRMNNPQTGHHTMNIPFSLDDIERIEILKGPGSRIYGPNAFGGVVNIILKEGKERNLSLNLSGGENRYYQGGASLELPYKNLYSRFSFSTSASDGYREATDFDIWNLASDISYIKEKNRFNFSASYLDKKFGANNFYSAAYPNQWEEVKVLFLQSNWTYQSKKVLFKPILSWRMGEDDYLLKRDDPAFYQNHHKTNVYHAEIQSQITSKAGVTTISIDESYETISSNNLGNHERNAFGGTFEHQLQLEQGAKIILGISGYSYTGMTAKYWPGIDFVYEFSHSLQLHASANKAFRVPTFTELYYSSPVNMGSENLNPEISLSYEFGGNYRIGSNQFNLAFFHRIEEDLIDWVLNPADSIWYAHNLNKAATRGLEFGWQVNPQYYFPLNPFSNVGISYTLLDRSFNNFDFISRYALNYLRHQVIMNFQHFLFVKALQVNWILRYADRENADDYFLTDLKISYPWKQFRFFINATNIFNTDYYEIAFIPMPGRWIKAGLTYKLGFN